jgi:hypothetical protein
MRLRLTHLLALLLLAGALAAPPAVRAECGHYVVRGTAASEPKPVAPEMPAPAPCNAPGCSRGKTLPQPPVLPAPVEREEWACADPVPRPPALRGELRRREVTAPRPRHFARDIDPPPRSPTLRPPA